ncbi:hypothetical protein LA5095_04446 [Roseibium album]|uniref:Uncharacterized protein n=1 Tax=Roseibium album TaxID=311410 RepID=A0A0M7ALR6_9HYPH|nr:hypothetical protein LA5094_04631 [Roseibium album]CTQ75170.1 hypothetical protein LA5096_04257 [Roseibium album]CTQ78671.1 hypothetical protein LA5095_04446 [Roseibium album]
MGGSLGPEDVSILFNAYSACRTRLYALGCSVRVLRDFREVVPTLEACGKDVTPFFQTRFFDFNGHNGFCHVAFAGEEPVSFYCSQLFDTGGMNYLEYHRLQLSRIYGDAYKVDHSWVCPPMEEIQGKVIYSGDALNVSGFGSAKVSLERLALIARMNLYLGLATWKDAAVCVGLARADRIRKSLGDVYGAFHRYPYATRWVNPPADRKQDDMFLFNWPSDVLYLAKIDAHGTGLTLEELD